MTLRFKHKILSAIMAFSLIFGVFGFTASAVAVPTASDTKPAAEKPAFNYVALGASNVNGYGLRGYNLDEVYDAPFKKAEDNRYGYKMDTPGSYPVLLRDELGKNYNVNFDQVAMSSWRAEELRFLLDESYDGDSYTDSWLYDINGDGISNNWGYGAGLYEWRARAAAGLEGYDHVPTPEEALATLRDAVKNDVADANLITVDVGMNNFGTYMMSLLADGIYSSDITNISPEMKQYYEEAKGFAMGIINKVMGDKPIPENMFNRLADTLSYALVGYCVNFDAVMERIYELNPDAEVVVISIQNMMRDMKFSFPGFDGTLPLGDMFSMVIDGANLYTSTLSPHSDKYYYADVTANGRVEFFLDEIAVYDGDPASISVNMKDCFDVYDGTMYLKTRVQQTFAIEMSKRGIVTIDDSQKDTASTDGLTAFYYGFHYDAASEDTPVITLKDGTPLKDFIKKGDAGKLTGDDKTTYGIYKNLLEVAYDAMAEMMRAAANADTLDLGSVFSSAVYGVSVNDIIFGVLGDAMASSLADQNYRFDINEAYPDGFFNAIKEEYSLPDGFIDSLFAFSMRLSFAGTAFSHPNEKGHQEVSEIVIKAYREKTTGKDYMSEKLGVHYMPTEDSYYVSVSEGNADYAKPFGSSIGLTEEQVGSTGWENIDYSEIDKADMVSIAFNEADTLDFAFSQTFAHIGNFISSDLRSAFSDHLSAIVNKLPLLSSVGLESVLVKQIDSTVNEFLGNKFFEGRTMQEMDWAKLLGEEALPLVELVRAEMKNTVLAKIGIKNYTYTLDLVEWIANGADSFGLPDFAASMLKNSDWLYNLLGDKATISIEIPLLDSITYAMESYLYKYMEYTIRANDLISYINTNFLNTKILIFGHYNPIRSAYLELGDSVINVGELFDLVTLLSCGKSLMQYKMSDNSAFIDVSDTKSVYDAKVEKGEAEGDFFSFLSLFFDDKSIVDISPESNDYIVDQLLSYVSIDCDHKYDNDCDAFCNKCEEERAVSHIYGGCADTSCDLCGEIRDAKGHTFGDWTVTKEAAVNIDGEKHRACSVCGHTETEKIPALPGEAVIDDEDGLPTGAIIGIILGAVAVAGGCGFAAYWFIFRKKKAPAAEAPDADAEGDTSAEESEAPEEDRENN